MTQRPTGGVDHRPVGGWPEVGSVAKSRTVRQLTESVRELHPQYPGPGGMKVNLGPPPETSTAILEAAMDKRQP